VSRLKPAGGDQPFIGVNAALHRWHERDDIPVAKNGVARGELHAHGDEQDFVGLTERAMLPVKCRQQIADAGVVRHVDRLFICSGKLPQVAEVLDGDLHDAD
jgi:hypothetical protein